ncbi:AsmA-like C-terminal region [Flavobacterium segetis]|uniref:AsmA-like C-terminal region n=1 Tax=Flavobacterium segetis TaxID=271157 RepID=A0A1M5FCQ7_9FLAO|nr:AsmA-like C-terminal region-containing protein [Flavobacterium segetis]SHF89259.1 AsmA-like C-terminal region [Flavobacterium segetis]
MKLILERFRNNSQSINIKQILKQVLFFFAGLLVLLLITSGVFAAYFISNKEKIVTQINAKINDNIKGTIHINDVNYKFLKGFPNMTLALIQVELKDSLWTKHKRTLLKAQQIDVRINIIDLIVNEVNIDKIDIHRASIHLYKGKDGLTNTNIFKNKPKNDKSKSSTTSSVHEINLSEVHFISENQLVNKLFDFDKIDLRSIINFQNDNWHTNLYIKTVAKNMAFNTDRGSFIKDKMVVGILKVAFNEVKNEISIITESLSIGNNFFDIRANFSLNNHVSPFNIAIATKILWRDASALLSNNISLKVDQFNLKNPIKVGCTIIGDMSKTGDPEINVFTKIKENELTIPDGLITDCSFDASFTNNYKKEAGCNDINSTITLTKFTGKYKTIPFSIPVGKIANLEKTTASGIFNSNFDVSRLNKIVSEKLIRFSSGQAKVNFDFRFGIVNLKIDKPYFTGKVTVKDAIAEYGPRNISFVKTNVELDFTEQALLIKKITFKDNKSSVFMEGKIDNFLTLYYKNPKDMVVDWNIYAPFLDVKKVVNSITISSAEKENQSNSKDDFSDELYEAIKKCQVVLNVKADKMVYNKLEATAAKVLILLKDNELIVKNGIVNSSGGTITFDGKLTPERENFMFKSTTKIEKVDISKFLYSLNNFGIESFKPSNLEGFLTADATIEGKLLSGGALKTNSLLGKAKFKVKEGALIEFKPITNIAKFAFPFRDVNNIKFRDLSGNFIIKGELINVNELKVSSNILNIDVNGIYSFGRGTKLAITIPLRNPKNDKLIVDKEERAEKRLNGIVLHLLAVDKEGKIKIRWNKNHQ